LLRFENVGLRYGLGAEVVRDLNFDIAPQSFQFLTGPSGAGKTTLLRLMLLSLRPTRGTIEIFGADSATLGKDAVTALRRRIGVVFQDFRLLEHLTTYENVALPLRVMGRGEPGYRAEVVELLRWVGLGDRLNAVPAVLSGGEKQRAAFARALIVRPELLLADEPTGNVDPTMAWRLLRLFMELHKSGTAVVIATHDLALMDQFGYARRLVVNDGRVTVVEPEPT
jgi:cell division transport system ATP-binding protein